LTGRRTVYEQRSEERKFREKPKKKKERDETSGVLLR
jgi:hypothetical protein